MAKKQKKKRNKKYRYTTGGRVDMRTGGRVQAQEGGEFMTPQERAAQAAMRRAGNMDRSREADERDEVQGRD